MSSDDFYRRKTPVLCTYEYLGEQQGRVVRRQASLMLEVEFVEEEVIRAQFELEMRRRSQNHRPSDHVGAKPIEWRLTGILRPKDVPKTLTH